MSNNKLPANFVKKPNFDSPLRRTDGPELSVVETHESGLVVGEGQGAAALGPEASLPAAKRVKARTPKRRKKPQADESTELTYRTTLRLSQEDYEALETECHARRLAGQRTNVAELLREIVAGWTRKNRRSPS